ncbi:MAG: 2-C-methyl-D-erythritol 2,4-cyclodiphosphate synthase [Candidatus Aminicenantes bacterium]|nr:2-C-methyl-D-erythritol 2,4-cyclodiphosphate synthase [Candidatus Aminicenantes bacterium]
MSDRIGLGYDIHRMEKGRPLILGGVEIPFTRGLMGHSDGDALIHALIDGLLGAMGEGDIGTWFPDTDPAYKDIRSTELLKRIMQRVRERGFSVIHVDSIVIAEEPKLYPFIKHMKEELSSLLDVHPDNIGLKAKTNEGFGPVGQKQAVICWAQVLLGEKNPA